MAGIAAGVYSLHVYRNVSAYVEMDAEVDTELGLLVYVVVIIAGVYPLHLFLNVYSDVYI